MVITNAIWNPPPPVYPFYDPNFPDGGTPVQFELVPRDQDDKVVAFSVSELNGTAQGWNATGVFAAPPGVDFPVYTPPGPWGTRPDGLSFVAFVGASITHIDSVTATENSDGTGATYDLTAGARLFVGGTTPGDGTLGNDDIPTVGIHYSAAGVLYTIFYDIPDPPVAYVQSVRMTGYRQYEIQSLSKPPPTPPPSVTGGNTLEADNPGFNATVERSVDFWDDLVQVFLGDRVNLTVESEGSKLGFHDRGHIINRVEMDLHAEVVSGVKTEQIDWAYTLEKIPGTLLPGAGTSSPEQDTIGTGAEIPLFLSLDTPGTGIDLGGLA